MFVAQCVTLTGHNSVDHVDLTRRVHNIQHIVYITQYFKVTMKSFDSDIAFPFHFQLFLVTKVYMKLE